MYILSQLMHPFCTNSQTFPVKTTLTFATFWHVLWPSLHCPVAPAFPSVDFVTVQLMMIEHVRLSELPQLLDYNMLQSNTI